MIPSEFNQDIMAQRRKLRVLYEARGAAARRAYIFSDRVAANKFADFVGEQGNMEAESFKPASGGRTNVTVAFQNQRDIKRIDAAHSKMKGIKEEVLGEAKFKIGDRVRLTGKTGERQKKNGFSTTGKIKEVTRSSGNSFFLVTWDDGKNSSRFDLQSRLGLDIVKEETLKGPTKDSWLTTAKVGGLFNVFRVFGDSRDADIERLPRVHTSAQAANKAARAIGDKTGEELRKS